MENQSAMREILIPRRPRAESDDVAGLCSDVFTADGIVNPNVAAVLGLCIGRFVAGATSAATVYRATGTAIVGTEIRAVLSFADFGTHGRKFAFDTETGTITPGDRSNEHQEWYKEVLEDGLQ